MTEAPAIAPGRPIWVDLASPDMEASKRFYGELFGWENYVTPDPAAGGYTMFKLDGKEVAGVGPIMVPGQPPAWSVYIGSEDINATTEAAQKAGGQVLFGPMQVMAAGSMAVLMDPNGAAISVWQPGEHRGYEVSNAPGSVGWTELSARDIDSVKSFYHQVFGWDARDASFGLGQTYTEWLKDGQSIAGAMPRDDQWPSDVPPFWMTYFVVSDAGETAGLAVDLGGEIVVPPTEFDLGRFAILRDPTGASFGVLEYKQQNANA